MNPIHRDDIDASDMAEIEKLLAEQYPGMKIVCAGDAPGELPPDVAAMMQQVERAHMESLANGTCIDCGAKMPDYDIERGDWNPPEGWAWFYEHGTKNIAAWQCPACDAKDCS